MTPTTLDALRDALLLWCSDITGRDIVLANSGEGAKPRVPYCEVFITQYGNNFRPSNNLDALGTTESINATELFSVSINAYGDNPMQDVSKLAKSLYSAKRYLDLWQISGLGQIKTTQDLTALETGALKQRALLEFTIYAQVGNDFASDFVETVPIDVSVPDKNYNAVADGGTNPRAKAAICNP